MERHHEGPSDLGEELSVLPPYSQRSIPMTSFESEGQSTSASRQHLEPKSPTTAETAFSIDCVRRDSDCDESRSGKGSKHQDARTESTWLHSGGRVSRKRRRNWQGWRHGLRCATIFVCAILLVNALTAIVAVICLHDKSDGGVVPLYTGSKSAVNARATGVHLVINALSALLLSGANYSMQCLAAPTRSELDRAHRRHKRLDVGVPSARNLLGGISWKRSSVWIVLLLSSLPIHTFYNAIVFTTLNTNEYDAWVVNESFLNPNITADELQNWALQAQVSENTMFSSDGQSDAQKCARGVHSVHAAFAQPKGHRTEHIERLDIQACNRDYFYDIYDEIAFSHRSTLVLVTSERGIYENQSLIGYVSYDNLPRSLDDGQFQGHKVDYCLSQITMRSTLQLSFQLAGVVIACNLMIALAMLWLLFRFKAEPLVTVGDALTSFLDDPDGEAASVNNLTPSRNGGDRRKRFTHRAISRARWIMGLAVIVICFLMAGAFVGFGLWVGGSSTLAFGLDDTSSPTPGAYVQIAASVLQVGGGPPRLLSSVLMANLPQLVCSLFYLVYNGLLSTLLLGREWNRFYLRKHILRVSDPKGQQRSTYYLQVPFRYGIPLVSCSLVLHWFVSQSIFVVFISTWNSSGEKVDIYSENEAVTTSTTGTPQLFFSRLGLLLAAILSFLMIIALIWFGFKKLPGGMPIVGSNSRLIAAACHRPDDDLDAAYLPISWGELVHDGGKGPGHCCFTSKDVQAPAWIREHESNMEPKHQSDGWMLRKCRSVCDKFSDLTNNTPGLRILVRRRAQKRELEQQAVWLYAGT